MVLLFELLLMIVNWCDIKTKITFLQVSKTLQAEIKRTIEIITKKDGCRLIKEVKHPHGKIIFQFAWIKRKLCLVETTYKNSKGDYHRVNGPCNTIWFHPNNPDNEVDSDETYECTQSFIRSDTWMENGRWRQKEPYTRKYMLEEYQGKMVRLVTMEKRIIFYDNAETNHRDVGTMEKRIIFHDNVETNNRDFGYWEFILHRWIENYPYSRKTLVLITLSVGLKHTYSKNVLQKFLEFYEGTEKRVIGELINTNTKCQVIPIEEYMKEYLNRTIFLVS